LYSDVSDHEFWRVLSFLQILPSTSRQVLDNITTVSLQTLRNLPFVIILRL